MSSLRIISDRPKVFRAPPTWFNYLYFTSRFAPVLLLASTYFPWFMTQTTNWCNVLLTAHGASMVFLQLIPHVFMIYRCWVFVKAHPLLRFFLVVFRSIVLCLQVVATIFAHKLFTGSGNPLKGEFGCFGDPNGRGRVQVVVYTAVSYSRHCPSISIVTSLSRVYKLMGSSTDIIAGLIVVWYYYVIKHERVHTRLGKIFVRQTLISVSFVLVATAAVIGLSTSEIAELRGVGLVLLVTVPNVLVCRWSVFPHTNFSCSGVNLDPLLNSVLSLREASGPRTEEELSRLVDDDLATQNSPVDVDLQMAV
ncbi:hypothetical protein BDN72DRAFT_904203 [Pluteus cervinus]|uniref:Uncharacterized protein n=1 Tax=Pluteus cervinus TaxID=181527 RepID=A0ACD3A7G2_9AGAR|nr:hypothetical protein BDN72DRAFT_904203 [Pluteus cervinus]